MNFFPFIEILENSAFKGSQEREISMFFCYHKAGQGAVEIEQ